MTIRQFLNHMKWFGEDRPFAVSVGRWHAMMLRLDIDGFTFLINLANNPWGDHD